MNRFPAEPRNLERKEIFILCKLRKRFWLLAQYLINDRRGVFPGVLDEPDMRVHAAAHNASQIQVRHVAFHGFRKLGWIKLFVIGKVKDRKSTRLNSSH